LTRPLLQFLGGLAFFLSGPLYAQPSIQHDIELELTPSTGAVTIVDRVEVEARDSYRFRLAAWLRIDELRLNGDRADARRDGADWVVGLPDNNRQRLEFSLRGVLPARTDAPGLRSSGGADGVYLPGYDDWIPNSGESIRYRLQVTLPLPQLAVATGKLVEEGRQDGDYRAVFESARPAEPPSLFAGPYRVRERLLDSLRLRTYFHEELVGLADTYLDASAKFIQRYSETIGDYPYADFHVISAPLPVGLGFPNLTYVGRQVLPLPFMRGRSLAHEVLHNWWGNGVAVDYASGNWSEGLTTYLADYALQLDQGEAAARGMRVKWLRDYAALPPERDQAVRYFTSKSHQAAQVIGYNKVAFIFHMLREEIGAGAFDAGLRLFWQRHRFATAGWGELEAAFEQAASRDLGWFFTQWVERRGAPRLSLGTHEVRQVEDGYVTRVEILQPVSGYRFRLPVLLVTADGRERHEIIVDQTLTRVEWKTSGRPESIHFDPDSDLFRRLQPDEAPPIMRDVTLDANTLSAVVSENEKFAQAARALATALMDVKPRFDGIPADGRITQPLLLITSSASLARELERLGIPQPAGLPGDPASAAAWTARLPNGSPVLVVSADDSAALKTLVRPLPHYGGQSYVLFANGRAFERGIWPVSRGPLYLDLGKS